MRHAKNQSAENFYERVYREVKKVPKGKVATYGQIASLISTPRAARTVGFALRALGQNFTKEIPWQRVISSQGMISIENPFVTKKYQADLLRKEGVVVEERDGNFFINLSCYQWRSL